MSDVEFALTALGIYSLAVLACCLFYDLVERRLTGRRRLRTAS